MLKEKIINLRCDKVRKKTEGEGEYVFNSLCFSVGMSSHTPSNNVSLCTGIQKKTTDNLLYFTIYFENGEWWDIYPTPPFDVGYKTEMGDG